MRQPPGAGPVVRPDKQGKHIPGHNNFQPGKSEWTHPDPQALLDQFGGTGTRDGHRELGAIHYDNTGMITQEGRISSPPAREAVRELEERLKQFDLWAATADRAEDGWESDFPEWGELIQVAEQVMAVETQDSHTLLLLGRCWAISEEGETCADWAREHIQKPNVQEIVRRLTESVFPDTRWQAYDVFRDLKPLDTRTQTLLESGMEDEDPYVRRRAFLVLFDHSEIDRADYIARMLNDTDSYNRSIAAKQGKHLGVAKVEQEIRSALQDPEVAFLYSLVGMPQRKPL